MHVRFTIVRVDYREAESDEEALRAAAAHAVQNALDRALDRSDVALLEPVMRLEVVAPSEFLGNIQADLNMRQARIIGSEHRGDLGRVDGRSAAGPDVRVFQCRSQRLAGASPHIQWSL